jgi:hypothetical protein
MSPASTTTSNIALKVPFNEKDQAKSLGARWNAESKQWYVPQGIDASPFEKWFTSPQTLSSTPQGANSLKSTNAVNGTQNQSLEDDLDTINAKLRDAYESHDSDGF